jgi:hypothetical protein
MVTPHSVSYAGIVALTLFRETSTWGLVFYEALFPPNCAHMKESDVLIWTVCNMLSA